MGSLKCSLNGRLLATARAARRRVLDRPAGETDAAVSSVDGLARVVVGCVLDTIVAVEPWTSGAMDVVVPVHRSWLVIAESDAGAGTVVAVVIVAAVAWELSRDKNEMQQPWNKRPLELQFFFFSRTGNRTSQPETNGSSVMIQSKPKRSSDCLFIP